MSESPQQHVFLGAFIALGIPAWVTGFILFVTGTSGFDRLSGYEQALAILSAFLFLADFFCILWWYSQFVYPAEPTLSLWTYILDFSVCASLTTAAFASWQYPEVFLGATILASIMLLCRFFLVYRGKDATDTDKIIILCAAVGLVLAIVLAVMGALIVVVFTKKFDRFLYSAPGILSLIGIILTVWLHERITIAAGIRERRPLWFPPMAIHWPKLLHSRELIQNRIRSGADSGLGTFHNLFQVPGARLSRDRLTSRVHAEKDLVVQSCILAVPSQDAEDEILWKAFIVGLSHWLDDLLDGCKEATVVRALRLNGGFDFGVRNGNVNANRVRELFDKIYRREIQQHTGRRTYRALVEQKLAWAVPDPQNAKYMYLGLVRVGAGAAMFSPRITKRIRDQICVDHNEALRTLASSDATVDLKWRGEIVDLLRRMNQGQDNPGRILLSLTTKTAQELAMSSEKLPLNFPLSVLYSLLYAPLLYFHDVQKEVECREIISLDNFSVNFDRILGWLGEIRELCLDERSGDNRWRQRRQQLEMAYHCFGPRLPQSVREALEGIYLKSEEEEDASAVIPMPKDHPRPVSRATDRTELPKESAGGKAS